MTHPRLQYSLRVLLVVVTLCILVLPATLDLAASFWPTKASQDTRQSPKTNLWNGDPAAFKAAARRMATSPDRCALH